MYSNKKLGNVAENEFAQLAYKLGYWVHLFATKITGQPFDCICVKDKIVWFLDIKYVQEKDYILHSRFEENQLNAFKMLAKRNVKNVGFVIKFGNENGEWYYLPFTAIDFNEKKTYKKDMFDIPL